MELPTAGLIRHPLPPPLPPGEGQAPGGRKRGGAHGKAARPIPKKDLAGGAAGESASCPAPPPPGSLKAQACSLAPTAANSGTAVAGAPLTWEATFILLNGV